MKNLNLKKMKKWNLNNQMKKILKTNLLKKNRANKKKNVEDPQLKRNKRIKKTLNQRKEGNQLRKLLLLKRN